MKDLEKMFGKKKKDDGSDPMKKDAKMEALKGLRGMASGMMKDGMKATVMAKDKSGLEAGLEKAKEVVKENPFGMPHKDSDKMAAAEESSGMDLDNDNEEGESPEHKAEILAHGASSEDLDAMIKALEDKKREMLMKG